MSPYPNTMEAAKHAEAPPTGPGRELDTTGNGTFAVPSFYITGRQPLSPGAILLAIVVAVGALCSVVSIWSHHPGGPAANHKEDDDPDQVDVIVVGGPPAAPAGARPANHVSEVHPTLLVHLPRFGEQVGLIPNTLAGHALYTWLAAFNQANYPALAKALPSAGGAAVTAAQLELRRQTGGFSLLSAKEIESGILVFRLCDQTPSATEVLGTLLVLPNSNPAAIASFRLEEVALNHSKPTAGAASSSGALPR